MIHGYPDAQLPRALWYQGLLAIKGLCLRYCFQSSVEFPCFAPHPCCFGPPCFATVSKFGQAMLLCPPCFATLSKQGEAKQGNSTDVLGLQNEQNSHNFVQTIQTRCKLIRATKNIDQTVLLRAPKSISTMHINPKNDLSIEGLVDPHFFGSKTSHSDPIIDHAGSRLGANI